GEKDSVIDSRVCLSGLEELSTSDLSIVFIPDAGHFCPEDDPTTFNASIKQWASDHDLLSQISDDLTTQLTAQFDVNSLTSEPTGSGSDSELECGPSSASSSSTEDSGVDVAEIKVTVTAWSKRPSLPSPPPSPLERELQKALNAISMHASNLFSSGPSMFSVAQDEGVHVDTSDCASASAPLRLGDDEARPSRTHLRQRPIDRVERSTSRRGNWLAS
ncbi:hypothetical protein HK102_005934, partial [Quaeritorhiza haematococci]